MPLNPEATFDSLFIASRLQRETDTLTAPEIHLFGYLACLLWLYRRRAVSDWGYSFVGTELGAPFSLDIDYTVKVLIERGYFIRIQERIRLSELADQRLRDLEGLVLNQERAECLRAACASIAAFSAGMVGSALAQEPDLRRSRSMPTSRPLLEDSVRSQLYGQFETLRASLLHAGDDLRLPAVVWLTALYRTSELTP
jgi:hypothetical protein